MPENSPPTKREGLSPEQQTELSRLVAQDGTLAYMIRRAHPLTWNNYVELNWGTEPPVEKMDEVEVQVRDLLQEMEK